MKPTDAPSAQAVGELVSVLVSAPLLVAQTLANAATGLGRSGCNIPPPCWEPRPAGDCRLIVVPGGTATIRVHITNCGWQQQVVAMTAGGVLAGWLSFEPTTLVLGPQSTATMRAIVHAPKNAVLGAAVSGPLLVRGCRDHFARIRILVADCAGSDCCDVMIDDCADHIHHWYDHFYCPRPCNQTRTVGTVARG